MFEVMTTKLSHQMNPRFLAGGSEKLWHLNQNITTFKTELMGEHTYQGMLFLGHTEEHDV